MAGLSVRLRRHWGTGAMLGGAFLAACSVDTSDVTFIRDDAFDQGAVGSGGVVGNAGVLNGGALNKAGFGGKASGGSGGAPTGGSKLTAGSDAGGSAPVGGAGGMNLGGMGGGGVPECPVAVADPTQPLLDDINDPDPALPNVAGRIGGWYLATDGTPGGTVLPMTGPDMPPMPSQPGALGSPYAMHVSGGGFTVWGISFGLALLAPFRDAPACPYDLSRQAGVRFMMKGMVSDMLVRVQVTTVRTHQPMQGGTCVGMGCGDHYGLDVPISGNWQEVKVDFADMTQVGWGRAFPLDLSEALNIEFHTQPNATFDVWVDDLSFY